MMSRIKILKSRGISPVSLQGLQDSVNSFIRDKTASVHSVTSNIADSDEQVIIVVHYEPLIGAEDE